MTDGNGKFDVVTDLKLVIKKDQLAPKYILFSSSMRLILFQDGLHGLTFILRK